ncbi:MAG: flagellar biosynthetic protein FliO [Spirochaetales bacterium]|jgi:flagellar protein FliO/FliZ|nr:flagellar biosynthetic protein FliO [Spirochaetales bacterium]
MVLVLAVVVGLIYGIFYFLKRAGAPRDDGVRFIRVLESRPLAGSKHLHIVEVGNHVLLVGSADNAVSLVTEISDKETLDGIRLKASEVQPRPGTFSELVRGLFGRRPGENHGPADGGSRSGSSSFMKKQRERLKKLL